MSLRTAFFALTYDRQIAGAERAGLHVFREHLLPAPTATCSRSAAGPGPACPATART